MRDVMKTIREGHMHEHGLLCTSVPYVIFDEGGWLVVR